MLIRPTLADAEYLLNHCMVLIKHLAHHCLLKSSLLINDTLELLNGHCLILKISVMLQMLWVDVSVRYEVTTRQFMHALMEVGINAILMLLSPLFLLPSLNISSLLLIVFNVYALWLIWKYSAIFLILLLFYVYPFDFILHVWVSAVLLQTARDFEVILFPVYTLIHLQLFYLYVDLFSHFVWLHCFLNRIGLRYAKLATEWTQVTLYRWAADRFHG